MSMRTVDGTMAGTTGGHHVPGRRTRRSRRWLAAGVVALVPLTVPLAACGDDADAGATGDGASQQVDAAPGVDAAAAALDLDATVIDVRTPAEYDAGHVEGATLVDIQGTGFDAAVADLDPDATYVVYCRSGNRSAQAAEVMRAAGLTVLDGGALADMAAGGWATA
jgi:rhodanese-related sulfurtransferase